MRGPTCGERLGKDCIDPGTKARAGHQPKGHHGKAAAPPELPASYLANPLKEMKIRWDGFEPPADGKALRTLNGARFGWTRSGGKLSHGGVDLHADVGTPAFAVADGVIEEVNPQHGNYGVSVLMKFRLHEYYQPWLAREPGVAKSRVLSALYAHLNPGSVRVSKGMKVLRGQTQVGETGVSGNGDQRYPHLHFEIRKQRWAGGTGTVEGIANRMDPERLFTVDFIEPFTAAEFRRHLA